MDIIREESKTSLVKSRDGVPTPEGDSGGPGRLRHSARIHAKKVLSVAVHNHYKRLAHRLEALGRRAEQVEHPAHRPHGLGQGRFWPRRLARILDVPFTMADATTLTEGRLRSARTSRTSSSSCFQASDYNVERAQRGDPSTSTRSTRSRASRTTPRSPATCPARGVQQALLKIMEGTVASVPPQGGRKHPQQEFLQVDHDEHPVHLRRRLRRAGEDHLPARQGLLDRLSAPRCPRPTTAARARCSVRSSPRIC